ncbi:hypothetical protein ASZ90_014737 [hydrocarbon metagenome]|uniref:Uncharacterized protein n=1 Tax=hydrocarbon metagenome TaxID=938273 RepID=A0A0W8F3W2_9ZZZZ
MKSKECTRTRFRSIFIDRTSHFVPETIAVHQFSSTFGQMDNVRVILKLHLTGNGHAVIPWKSVPSARSGNKKNLRRILHEVVYV